MRRATLPRRNAWWAFPLLTLALPGLASAQEVVDGGFDAHGFHLAAYDGDPRDGYSILRPGRMHQWEFYTAALFEYASAPLSFVEGPPGNTTMEAALGNLVTANLAAGITPIDRLRLDVAMPLHLLSSGPDGAAQGTMIGDLRVGAMVAIIRPGADVAGGLGVGLAPWVDVPTGDDTAYLGNTALSGGAAAALTYEFERFHISSHLGYQHQPAITTYNMTGADQLLAAVGAGWLFDRYSAINFEALLTPPLQANLEAGTNFPVETILSYRRSTEAGAHFSVGAAAALSDGAGASPFRAFVGGGFGRLQTPVPPDLDGDGIPNNHDDCYDDPEIFNGYKDEDGCPDFMGTIDVWGELDGEQVDLDQITLVGPQGPRPLTPGQAQVQDVMPGTQYTAKVTGSGCLGGTAQITVEEGKNGLAVPLTRSLEGTITFEIKTLEGAPIPGAVVQIRSVDAICAPAEGNLELGEGGTGSVTAGAGDHVVIVDVPQYALYRQKINLGDGETEEVVVSLKKSKTRVTAQRIEIFEKVHFETGKAIIKPDSFELLDEVAEAINTHKQIKLVEVAGHTDDQGSLESNQTLSQNRAAAVMDYLVGKGVDASRLQAKGYGETRTIDTNETEEGRAKNRRVEFNILEQDTVILED